MAVLFDSEELSACHADEALTALFTDSGLPINVSHVSPDVAGPTIVEQWSFAEQSLFVARGNTLRLTRSGAEVKACAPEGIRLGYQLTGSYQLVVGDYQEADAAGQLNVTDLTQPCEFTLERTRAQRGDHPSSNPTLASQPGLPTHAGAHGALLRRPFRPRTPRRRTPHRPGNPASRPSPRRQRGPHRTSRTACLE